MLSLLVFLSSVVPVVALPAAAAAAVRPVPIGDLARAADVVVVGEVVAVRGEHDAGSGQIRTVIELRPVRIFKGRPVRDPVVFRQLGGEANGQRSVVSDTARFRQGECVLVFLRQGGPGGGLGLVAEFQGKYSVVRESGGAGWTAIRVEPDTGFVLDRISLERVQGLFGER